MNFSFPSSLIRPADLKQAASELRGVISQPDLEQAMTNISPAAQSLFRSNQHIIKDLSPAEFVDELEKAIDSAPVFDVILPTYPHDTFLEEIAKWFRGSIDSRSLIDISVRRSIGGGMILRSKNRLFDLSLRPKILAAKDKIPEVMKRV